MKYATTPLPCSVLNAFGGGGGSLHPCPAPRFVGGAFAGLQLFGRVFDVLTPAVGTQPAERDHSAVDIEGATLFADLRAYAPTIRHVCDSRHMGAHNERSEHTTQTGVLFRDLWRRMVSAEKLADERASIIVAQRKEIDRLRSRLEAFERGR